MVERFGHIKNPLTVVAIFAAIAEVSGTIVLPLLERETQGVYVWFLMLFPILLVVIFFFVLYQKHHVLYAPTDFKDDRTFAELFESASTKAKVAKINGELEETASEEANSDGSASQGGRQQAEGICKTTISAKDTLRRTIQGNGLLAEELVAAKLAKDMGIKFERNLALKGQPSLVFDAVATASDRAVVAEVRFTRMGLMSESMLNNYFERVGRFSESLPDNLRGKIDFVFALVTDSDDESRLNLINRAAERIRVFSQNYPFRTTVRIFSMQELEREFDVK